MFGQNNWTPLWIFHCIQYRDANSTGIEIRGLKTVEPIGNSKIKLLCANR
jgi:hypothetical protein